MSWGVGLPQGRWSDLEREAFFRDIYRRLNGASFTWNPPSIGANTTVDTTLTTTDAPEVKGLRVGQAVSVTPPSTLDAGLAVSGAWVATDNTLTIRLANVTASPINPASGTWAYHGRLV